MRHTTELLLFDNFKEIRVQVTDVASRRFSFHFKKMNEEKNRKLNWTARAPLYQ